MISYAQNFEDVMLARVFGSRTDGFYVDVGAGDPVNLSVTKWFYDLGWSGINIEPNRSLFKKLSADRSRDVNLECGAGASRKHAQFMEMPIPELSSFDSRVQASAREQIHCGRHPCQQGWVPECHRAYERPEGDAFRPLSQRGE